MTNASTTLVFYFKHNLDATVAAKAIESTVLQGKDESYTVRAIEMSPENPDLSIIGEVQKEMRGLTAYRGCEDDVITDIDAPATDILVDIMVLGYCPEDITTQQLLNSWPVTLRYFLYENNIQFSQKLLKLLAIKGLEKRAMITKPSMMRQHHELACSNSICDMLLLMPGAYHSFSTKCKDVMTCIARWFSCQRAGNTEWSAETRQWISKDLNVAWGLRINGLAMNTFMMDDAPPLQGYSTETNTARREALTATIFNTMSDRLLREPQVMFKTFIVPSEQTHDVYRRISMLRENYIIASRIGNGNGYLVTVGLRDSSKRPTIMRELGVSRFWMEGDKAVGYSSRNPLLP